MRIREVKAKMLPRAYRQLRESWTGRISGNLLLAIVVLVAVDAQMREGVRYGARSGSKVDVFRQLCFGSVKEVGYDGRRTNELCRLPRWWWAMMTRH
jgi:hypothetical protein